jgi:hypothetical protein
VAVFVALALRYKGFGLGRSTLTTLIVSAVVGGGENKAAFDLPPFLCNGIVICGKSKGMPYLVASIIPIWIGNGSTLSGSV